MIVIPANRFLGGKILGVPGHQVIHPAGNRRGHDRVVVQILEPDVVIAARDLLVVNPLRQMLHFLEQG
jgi:hypothetical protein